MIADILVLSLIASYCIYLIVRYIKKSKNKDINQCTGICPGCTGCSSISKLKEDYYLNQGKHTHG